MLVGGVAPAGYAWAFPTGRDTRAGGRGHHPAGRRHQPACSLRARGREAVRRAGRLDHPRAPCRADPQRPGARATDRRRAAGRRRLRRAVEPVARAKASATSSRRPAWLRRSRLGAPRRRRPPRAAALVGTGRTPRPGALVAVGPARQPLRARLDDGDWDRAVDLLATLPVETATALLRGEVLSGPCWPAQAGAQSKTCVAGRPAVRDGGGLTVALEHQIEVNEMSVRHALASRAQYRPGLHAGAGQRAPTRSLPATC